MHIHVFETKQVSHPDRVGLKESILEPLILLKWEMIVFCNPFSDITYNKKFLPVISVT